MSKIIENGNFLDMELTKAMKLNKSKKKTIKMNDIFETKDKSKLKPSTKSVPLIKAGKRSYQY
jgi:hypothetical protein